MRAFLIIILVGLLVARAPAQTTLELRTSCRFAPAMTLASVLIARGEHADEVLAVSLPARLAAPGMAVRIQDVRDVITDALPGLDWGSTSLSGSRCLISRERDEPETPAHRRADPDHWRTLSSFAPGTVGSALASSIGAVLALPATDIRLDVPPGDREKLDIGAAGQRIAIDLAGTGPRFSARVRLVDGATLARSFNLTVDTQVLRQACIAIADLPRGHVATAADIQVQARWMAMLPETAGASRVIGLETRRSIRAGEVLTAADLQAAQVVRRGQIMPVLCVTGSLSFHLRARALEAGRAGEEIEVETVETERKDRRRLRVRLTPEGSGLVVPEGT